MFFLNWRAVKLEDIGYGCVWFKGRPRSGGILIEGKRGEKIKIFKMGLVKLKGEKDSIFVFGLEENVNILGLNMFLIPVK